MKDEIKVGEYIRTKDGFIGKINKIEKAFSKLNEDEKQIDLEWVEENYIEKSKVREKIEEYNIALSKNQTIYSLNKMEEIRFAIRSMQELLED